MRWRRALTMLLGLLIMAALTQAQDAMGCRTGLDGFIYHMTEGGYQRGLGRIPEALYHFDCAIAQNSVSLLAYRQRGAVHISAGNYLAAIQDMTLVIDADPTDIIAMNGRGFAFLRMGNLQQAIDDFNRALAIDPNFSRAYNNRGIAYETRGNFAEAIADYNMAAELGHDPPHFPHWNLANLYHKRKQYPEAIRELQRVVQVMPSFVAAYKLMGDIYMEMGDHVQAEERYLQYVKLSNTADTSALEFIYALNTRQTIQRYAPSVLIGLILLYLGGRALWQFFRRVRARDTQPTVA